MRSGRLLTPIPTTVGGVMLGSGDRAQRAGTGPLPSVLPAMARPPARRPQLCGRGALTCPRSSIRLGRRLTGGLVARLGVWFAFIKSTEGTYYVNPYFKADAAAAKAAGLLVAAYHFANPANQTGRRRQTTRSATAAITRTAGRSAWSWTSSPTRTCTSSATASGPPG